jgi:crotonobetainyl-CoA:carnitine CoA-transferase CaiB-like acyl-CoA transferase
MAARDLLLPTGIDNVDMVGIALKMGLTPGTVRRPPPRLGADTAPILTELAQLEGAEKG